MDKLLLDAQETAALLGISYGHFRRLLSTDPSRLPSPLTIGSRKRWSRSSIAEWISDMEHKNVRPGSAADSDSIRTNTTGGNA